VFYFAVAAIVVIIDQASKRIVGNLYPYGGGTDLVGDLLRIRLTTNPGAVMGILGGSRVLLIVITIVSIAALVVFAYRMRYAPPLRRFCLALVLGGAFGNLIDRLAAGEVIDFIDMGIGAYRWPTYNVADIAITVGAVILVAGLVFRGEPARD